MKIIYVENVRVPSERAHAYQIVQTCAWLARFGHEVTLVNPSRAGDADVFRAYGLPERLFAHVMLRAWDPLTSAPSFVKAAAYGLQRWAFVRAARQWVRSQQADAWYTRDPAMVDALGGTVAGPWALELHDAPNNDPARWARIRDRVQRFVVISNGLKQKLIELGVPAFRVCVAHDGYDPALFRTAGDRHAERTRLGIPDDAFVAIYTGSFYPWKGTDLVVRAWTRTNPTAHLVMLGGPDADRKRIAALIDPSALGRVHILSTVERSRTIAMLAIADVGLLTSSPTHAIGRDYTSPLKQFEYLAAGLPVLASDVPSSHEVLEARVARYYEPTEAGFASALASVLNDNAWRETVRVAAASVVAPYTWEARARIIERCLLERV
ncbi:MAG TPA: glycosyltransferase [Candidatus Methylomirabilis sp.]|nr:glycosyltransferase [Candidatus Methylomirabilis sp.]